MINRYTERAEALVNLDDQINALGRSSSLVQAYRACHDGSEADNAIATKRDLAIAKRVLDALRKDRQRQSVELQAKPI